MNESAKYNDPLWFEKHCDKSFPDLRLVHTVTVGGHFGEIALEHKLPRTAAVYTKSECDLAVLTYEKY